MTMNEWMKGEKRQKVTCDKKKKMQRNHKVCLITKHRNLSVHWLSAPAHNRQYSGCIATIEIE